MKQILKVYFFYIGLIIGNTLYAQDSTMQCKVTLEALKGTYIGECRKGLAHGKGEAKGIFRYIGNFKNGLPNGKGIIYYGDNYFDGNFQDGIKEGKGEMHFKVNDVDSIIKGFWSADEYRGKTYKTYITDASTKFDRVEVSPSSGNGNKITIEISTTSNDFSGGYGSPKPSITLNELISVKLNSLLKLTSYTESAIKYTWTFEITEFPITLRGVLSNGSDFNLELYKSADWVFKIFLNK